MKIFYFQSFSDVGIVGEGVGACACQCSLPLQGGGLPPPSRLQGPLESQLRPLGNCGEGTGSGTFLCLVSPSVKWT